MNPEILPQKPFNPTLELLKLAPPETSSKEHITAVLDYLEAKADSWKKEQDRRMLKAEVRIRVCAHLKGLALGFGFPSANQHFSWCPLEAWLEDPHFDLPEEFLSPHNPKG